MCFTNLPIQFDEEGNPYLEEEAEDIEHPDECEHDHDHEHGRVQEVDMDKVGTVTDEPGPALSDLEPDEVYGSVLETLPDEAREKVETTRDADGDPNRDRDVDTSPYEPAKGD